MTELCPHCRAATTSVMHIQTCGRCWRCGVNGDGLRAEVERLRSLAMSLAGGREELPEWARLRVDAMLTKDGGT